MDIDTSVAIIGLDELKEYLKVTDPNQDAIIGAILNGVSGVVVNHIGWDPVSKEVTEYHDGDGSNLLILGRMFVSSVAEVNIDSNRQFGAGTEVDVASGIIVEKRKGIIRGWNVLGGFPCGAANIKVKYTAGWAPSAAESAGGPPNGVRLAVKRLADYHYRTGYTHRRLDVRSESVGDMTTTYTDTGIPGDVEKMLAPFRNMMPSPSLSYAD